MEANKSKHPGSTKTTKRSRYISDLSVGSTSNNMRDPEVSYGTTNKSKRSRCNSVLEEILIEILSWLPVSSLSRFRFVSNRWLTLITTDALLAKLHLERRLKSGRQSIIYISSDYHLTLLDDAGHKNRLLSMDDPLSREDRYCRISPCCNGLICIYSNTNMVAIFNPTTRQELLLPNPEVNNYSQYFLGFLPETKEYKVLRLYYALYIRIWGCEILTVGTGCWRQIDVDFGLSTYGGFTINGLTYMIVQTLDRGLEVKIFDLNYEKFETIKFPKVLSESDSILEFDGKACVAVCVNPTMELWILEDVTNRSWKLRYTLNFPADTFDRLEPILISQGKILIELRQPDDGRFSLRYYDLETGAQLEKINHDGDLRGSQVHWESLVSLESP